MSGKFEATIVDADRSIEFDATIHFETWWECGDERHAYTGHELTGGRVNLPGEMSAGFRGFVECELRPEDLQAVGVAWFAAEYDEPIRDAIADHVAAMEFAHA